MSWWISHISAKKQGRLSAYCQVETHLDNLQIQGIAYWSCSGLVPEAETALIARVQMMDLSVQALCRTRKVPIDTYASFTDMLDEIATGGGFQTVQRRRDLSRVVRLKEKLQYFKNELFSCC